MDEDDKSDQDRRSASASLGDTPSLVSEPEVMRSTQATRILERYNPRSHDFYIKICLNLVAQVKEKGRYL